MIRRFCDRCGTEERSSGERIIHLATVALHLTGSHIRERLLCYDCNKAVVTAIKKAWEEELVP